MDAFALTNSKFYCYQSTTEAEVELKLANVRKIWQRFLYCDSVMLEADRQNTTIGLTEDWAAKFKEIEGDDAFTTLVQVISTL